MTILAPSLLLPPLLVALLEASVEERRAPVTLRMDRADVREVIEALAALAGLEARIDPGVEGKISVSLEEVPFDRALARVGMEAGLTLRVEGTTLRASVAPRAPPVPPALPERFRGLPRLPASNAASSGSSLRPAGLRPLLRLRAGSVEACYQLSEEGRASDPIVLSAVDEEVAPVSLVPIAFDPVRRVGYAAIEIPDGPGRVVEMPLGSDILIGSASGPSRPAASLSDDPESCPAGAQPSRAVRRRGPKTASAAPESVLAHAELRTLRDGGPEVLFGWCLHENAGSLALQSALTDRAQKRGREWRLHCYISPDGVSAAFVLEMAAVWRDPTDGRDYVLTQTGYSTEFVKLEKGGVTALSIPAGPATDDPVELRVSAESERWDCASRAASREPRR